MINRIRTIRLQNEYRRIRQLVSKSSLMELVGYRGDPPEDYVFAFKLKGLVENRGKIEVRKEGYLVEVYCPPDYPREAPHVLLLRPGNVFHPNVAAPLICWGQYSPGLWLEDLCQQIADIISYKTYTLDESDALNKKACAWARSHQESLPVDPRLLVRRCGNVEVLEDE